MIYADAMGLYWMPLGLPMTDTHTVVFEPRKTAAGTVVKIALPDLPT